MAARLGGAVTLVGCVGRDPFGDQILDNFRTEGIDTRHIRRDAEQPTGTAAILVDDAARNCILVVAGANGALTPDDARAAAAAIQSADVLLCQLEVPLETVEEALRIAKTGGVRTILNPAPARDLSDDLLRLADFLAPNETEAEALTGKSATTEKGAKAAAESLRRRGARTVLLTRGEHGVLIADDSGVRAIPSVAVKAVDPTGAGDAFLGAFAIFLAARHPLDDAVRRAAAVAALTVTRPGAQASFPTRAEAEMIR
jgi:ribokinase